MSESLFTNCSVAILRYYVNNAIFNFLEEKMLLQTNVNDERLVSHFRNQGYRIMGNALTLPMIEGVEPTKFYIPEELVEDVGLKIACYEYGGWNRFTNHQRASIIASLEGNTLRPYSVPTDPPICGKHAYFSIYLPGLIMIRADIFRDEVQAFVLMIQRDKRVVWTSQDLIWEGTLGATLPPDLSYLARAHRAVIKKASCSDCVHAHYVDWVKKVRLPNPA